MVRPDRNPGRRHQRDLLRATGRGGIDANGDGGVARGDRKGGVVLCIVQRSRESLFRDGEGGGEGGKAAPDAGRASDEGVGSADDRGVFAAGAGAVGAQFWNLAGTVAARASTGRGEHGGGGQ